MTQFPNFDLYYVYRDEAPRMVLPISGLAEEELDVLLDALRSRFERQESSAFEFFIKQTGDYSLLDLVDRRERGEWGDSGIEEPSDLFAAAFDFNVETNLDEGQRQWLNVRRTAEAMAREVNSLRLELCSGPVRQTILHLVNDQELLTHLQRVEPVSVSSQTSHEFDDKSATSGDQDLSSTHRQRPNDESSMHKHSRLLATSDDTKVSHLTLTANDRLVLHTLHSFSAENLASIAQIMNAMPPARRLSDKPVRSIVNMLIKQGLAERPNGPYHGARLNIAGRRLAARITSSSEVC